MKICIEYFLPILISSIIFCGCISETVEDEIVSEPVLNCDTITSISYDSVIEADDIQAVVANVRAIQINETTQVLGFTEPLRGTFSVIAEDCSSECQSVEFVIKNTTAPLRLDSADFNGDGQNEIILSDIGILWPSDEQFGKVMLIDC